MGRAECRPRERQSRLSFGLRRAAGACWLSFLSRLPGAVARPAPAAAVILLTLALASPAAAQDTTTTQLLSAAVEGNTVTLVFNETVQGGDSPQLRRGHFHASVEGKQGLLSVQEIAYGGATVTLTLGQAVTSEDMFTLHYYQETRQSTQLQPTPEADKLQDANGNLVADFTRRQADGTLTNVAMVRAALVALYDATGGPNWTVNTNWKTAADFSTWHGVTADSEGRVTRLILEYNELTGTIPDALGNLTNLQWLDLSSNELTGTIPAELSDLTKLQWLILNGNTDLTGTIPDDLADLTKLQWLILNGNTDLTGPLPLGLMDLVNLTTVWIQDTGLCAPEDAAFRAWAAAIDDFKGGGGGSSGPSQTAPDAPTNLIAEAADAAVTLTWDAPEDDGGSAITDYEYRINGQGDWISIGSTDTTTTVTGLVNDTVYTFEVRAVNGIGRSQPSSDPVETTPRMPVALAFAHFANGAEIISDLVLVNAGAAPIQPAIYFYDQEGHLMDPESVVDITGDLMVTEDGSLTVQAAMEPLGELTITTHGRGGLVSGSVKVVAAGTVGGVLRFNLPGIGIAGVGASHPVTDALFPVRREGELSTAAAIRNLGEKAMVVACRLMQEGAVLEEAEITLEANGQEALYIEEMFTNTETFDFVGSVRCTAPPGEGMFTGVAVELDAENRIFTTLPVVPVDPSLGGGRETVLDFAHFANGDGITSELVFVNRSIRPSRPAPTPFHSDILPNLPVLYFYDQRGDFIDPESVVDITEDLEVTEDGSLTVLAEIEPLGVLTISTHGRGDLLSGSVKVISDRPIGGVLRFDLPDIGVAGVGVSLPLMDAIFPARRQAGGISTAAAIRNLGEEAMVVTCRLMKDGVVLEEVEIPLAPDGQEAQYIDEMFTGVAVELDAGNRIFTTLPVIPVQR